MNQRIIANTPEFHMFDLQKVEESKHMIFGADYILIQPNTVGCTLHLASKEYQLKDNQAVLLAPFNPFRLSVNKESKQELSEGNNVLHFRLNALGQTFVDSVQFHQIRDMLEKSKSGLLFDGEVIFQVRELLNVMENTFEFTQVLHLLNLLNILASNEPKQKLLDECVEINSTKRAEDRLHIALDFIEENLAEPLSVSMVSNQLHMAESTFSRFFHSNMGTTFRQYLIEQRVRQAARYLVTTDWSIAQIGAEVGFSSLSNFNSKFKGLLRVTPRQYRADHIDMRKNIDNSLVVEGQVQRQYIEKFSD
ncbi:AraC family transcriptional regulator [Vibrio sp. 99-8-1]|uniref:helix-turn-helix domain-containing protein n=1 Tax=Vibrio sp. 99-8-1 TaxID=2607602 RepID=UPI00149340FF|nr:AraC family transcriptional regulator [Vibrio sp. 99-8-1]NOI67122.1 helix-turn-helix transcriptional regulator [Vibrio sp. 99-8-1]